MKIIKKKWNEKGLTKRTKTTRIILHHAVYFGDIDGIDKIHRNQGFACIGYHFYVRLNGDVYEGRREDAVGAHATGDKANYDSIGVCFEGNFEKDKMPTVQLNAGREVVAYLKDKYKINKVQQHKEVNATACPGKNFPFKEMTTDAIKHVSENKTIRNIKELQKALKIVSDGIYGSQTSNAVTKVQIKRNCKNKEVVKFVQKLLGVAVDGVFGSQTYNAVVSFQKRHKIVADGWIGNVTMKLLIKN